MQASTNKLYFVNNAEALIVLLGATWSESLPGLVSRQTPVWYLQLECCILLQVFCLLEFKDQSFRDFLLLALIEVELRVKEWPLLELLNGRLTLYQTKEELCKCLSIGEGAGYVEGVEG